MVMTGGRGGHIYAPVVEPKCGTFVPLWWWWCGHSVLTDLYITPFSCVVSYLKKQ